MDGYVGRNLDMFVEADKALAHINPRPNNWKRPPKIVPMPRIEYHGSIEGPLMVTDDYLERWEKKKGHKEKLTKQQYLRLITKKRAKIVHLKWALADLSPHKEKDIRKIAVYNSEIQELEYEIAELKDEGGVEDVDITIGDKMQRFYTNLKKKYKKIKKKVKKFFKNNKETIMGILTLAVPVVTALATRMIFLKA